MAGVNVRTCDQCGGGITADEIRARQAGLVRGSLLCVACVNALREKLAAARAAQEAPPAPAQSAPAAETTEAGTYAEASSEPSEAAPADGPAESRPEPAVSESTETTAASTDSQPDSSRRCGVFFAPLTPEGLRAIEGQINTWLAAHPDGQIRHSLSTVASVGDAEPTPHLVLTLVL